ncbi:MAG: hypothetical protein PVG39_15800 [Desulfobacteraceae bacterium]
MKNIIYTFVLCLLIQGPVSAGTTMKLVPEVLKGQKIVTQENSEAVISHKKKSSVALRPPPDGYSLKARPMIYVSVYGADKSYDFSTEDIQVFVDGNPHQVLTYDAFVEVIKQRKENELKALKTRYDILAMNAAQGAYTSAKDPEVFAPGLGSTNVASPGARAQKEQTSSVYNVHSVARSQNQFDAEKQARTSAIEEGTAKQLAFADAAMLKKTTVLPNEWHRGYAAVEKMPDPAQPHEVKIIVTVAGEKHEFLFNHLKTQE